MAFNGFVLPFPFGSAGLTGEQSSVDASIQHLEEANNCSLKDSLFSREPGVDKYNVVAVSGEIIGGYDWRVDSTSSQQVIVTENGYIIRDDGSGDFSTTGGGHILASGLTTTGSVPVFVEGGAEASTLDKKLFIFTGLNPVKVLEGSATSVGNITSPPIDWASVYPTCGEIHENRLWGAGNANDPHRVYYSTVSDHEELATGGGSLTIYPGVGEEIVQLVSFKGLLVIFKNPMGIFAVDTSSNNVAEWRVRSVSLALGSAGNHAALAVDGDIIFFDPSLRIYRLSSVDEFSNLGLNHFSLAHSIHEKISRDFETSAANEIRSVYYVRDGEAHFGLRSKNGSALDRRFVIDFNREAPRFRISDRDTFRSLWLRRDINGISKPVYGGTDGFVYLMGQDDTDKAGSLVRMSLATPHLDFDGVVPAEGTGRNKILKFIELRGISVGPAVILCDIFIDGYLRDSAKFFIGSDQGTFPFELDVEQFARSAPFLSKVRVHGSGYQIQLKMKNDDLNARFLITRVDIGMLLGDSGRRV